MNLLFHKVHTQRRRMRTRRFFICGYCCVFEKPLFTKFTFSVHTHTQTHEHRDQAYTAGTFRAHWNNVDTHDCWIIMIIAMIAIHYTRLSYFTLHILFMSYFHFRAHHRTDIRRWQNRLESGSHLAAIFPTDIRKQMVSKILHTFERHSRSHFVHVKKMSLRQSY